MCVPVAKPQGWGRQMGEEGKSQDVHNDKLPRSGFVVRPRWCFTSTVRVRVGGSYNS